jgi:hypothetical protein
VYQVPGGHGIAATELLNSMLEGELDKEQDTQEKEEKLQWVIEMADKLRKIKKKDSKVKKCNFYNRGFCKEGFSCRFDHSESSNCETFSEQGTCCNKQCKKRHLYTCKYLITVGGCFRGEDCVFNHDVNVTENEIKCSVDEHVKEDGQKAKELSENVEDAKSKEAMKVDEASSVLDTVKESATENNIEDLIEASEDGKVEETVEDFYSDLTAAMAAQNDELQNAIMDKILEAYDKEEKNLEEKKEPKKIKKDKVKPKVKGKKRGQGRPSTNL